MENASENQENETQNAPAENAPAPAKKCCCCCCNWLKRIFKRNCKTEAAHAPENTAPEADAPADDDAPAPSKKRRWLKRILIALAAFIVVVLLVVAFLLGPIVKFGMNTFGASLLGVDKCSVDSVKIYPFGGYVRFEKIFIGKPIDGEHTFSNDVFSLDLVEVDTDMFSLFAQKKILDRFELRGLTAEYEQLFDGTTNIDVILKNLLGEKTEEELEAEAKEAEAEAAAKEAEEAEAEPEEPEEIFIAARYFVIENVKVGATERGLPVAFPAMSADFADGIGIDEDLTPVSFGMKVAGNFVSVIDFFRKSALSDAAGAAVGAVGDAAGATADAVSGAAGATADAVGDAAGATVDAVSGAAGAVVDLFSGSSSDDKKSEENK